MEEQRSALRKRIFKLLVNPDRESGEAYTRTRDALLSDIAAFQAQHVPVYQRLVKARGVGAALPTDVFRHARVAVHPASQDQRVFRTSGTTVAARGSHYFRALELYDLVAERWARHMLFGESPARLVVLAPNEREAPDSSLSYMLSRFGEWFGPTYPVWPVDAQMLVRVLDTSERTIVLGTSFAFVHAEEKLGSQRFQLPEGSRIMQTGGFKGRSREYDKAEMQTLLATRYGVEESQVIGEYGMTELSSQAYESTSKGTRHYRFGPWVRIDIVDPVTLEPTDGVGLLRVDDPANLDSCCMLQTADRARRVGDGFELLGRARGAVPRGCSLAVEEALG